MVEKSEHYQPGKELAYEPVGQVFPSEEDTILVKPDDEYGGAHEYVFKQSLGFENGEAKYINELTEIRFVKKRSNGVVISGLQSEQLVIALLDRHKKLNDKYPSEYYQQMKDGLEMFLDACKRRVEDRIDRGVMGNLEK